MALLSERTVTGIIASYLKLENIEPEAWRPMEQLLGFLIDPQINQITRKNHTHTLARKDPGITRYNQITALLAMKYRPSAGDYYYKETRNILQCIWWCCYHRLETFENTVGHSLKSQSSRYQAIIQAFYFNDRVLIYYIYRFLLSTSVTLFHRSWFSYMCKFCFY